MDVKQLTLEEIAVECYSAITDDYECEFCGQCYDTENDMIDHLLEDHASMI